MAPTSSTAFQTTDKLRDGLLEAIERGETPKDVARRLYPDDKRARKMARNRFWEIVGRDEALAQTIVTRARTRMLIGLGPATDALARRAAKGNIPAIKLLYEASGLHNPRVKHEHSGEVKIVLDMPRPSFGAEGHIEDAEVVEEPAETGPA